MLGGGQRLACQRLANGHGGQAAVFLVFLIIHALGVEREESVELHDLASGAKVELATAGFCQNIRRRALQARAFHLRGDGALPDQLIKAELVIREIGLERLGHAEGIGGADAFMRFLGVLRLGGIGARHLRQIALVEGLGDKGAHLARASGAMSTPSVRI